MLISFTLSNFMSFREEQTLTMTEGNSTAKPEHVVDGCLKAAAIFGGNASGKSSLIRGLKTLKKLVTYPDMVYPQPMNYWDKNDSDTKFRIVFSIDENQYTYELWVKPSHTLLKERSGKTYSRVYMFNVTKESLSFNTPDADSITDQRNDVLIFTRDTENVDSSEWQRKNVKLNEMTDNIRLLSEKLEKIDSEFDYIQREKFNAESIIASQEKIIQDYKENSHIYKRYFKTINLYKQESKDNEKRLTELKEQKKTINKEIFEKHKERIKLSREVDSLRFHNNFSNRRPIVNTGFDPENTEISVKLGEGLSADDVNEHISKVHEWFVNSVIALETDDFHLQLYPDIGLQPLSKVVESLDVGIDDLSWEFLGDVNDEKIRLMEASLSEKDLRRLNKCKETSLLTSGGSFLILPLPSGIYLFAFWLGKGRAYQMLAHHKGGKRTSTISKESDGTRRIIELASMLIDANQDTVYIVDELDRRLHPLLSKRFVEALLSDPNENKQLIFSTHETRLLTTDLFRRDEIWLMNSEEGSSRLYRLDEVRGIRYNNQIESKYLKSLTLPGAPKVELPDVLPGEENIRGA